MQRIICISLCLFLLIFLYISVSAAEEATPTLDWSVLACGGGTAQVSSTSLSSTIGQAIVGEATVASQKLCVGFWCSEVFYRLFLPLILRGG
ncbi:MAG: hypothetical protein DDG59_15195 [Anaerolineae bacterium]|nr:MAG: hypothetical protein DDG59_15195 [Anaerolineae bacterium]